MMISPISMGSTWVKDSSMKPIRESSLRVSSRRAISAIAKASFSADRINLGVRLGGLRFVDQRADHVA